MFVYSCRLYPPEKLLYTVRLKTRQRILAHLFLLDLML
jgi:hypothetical protein